MYAATDVDHPDLEKIGVVPILRISIKGRPSTGLATRVDHSPARSMLDTEWRSLWTTPIIGTATAALNL